MPKGKNAFIETETLLNDLQNLFETQYRNFRSMRAKVVWQRQKAQKKRGVTYGN